MADLRTAFLPLCFLDPDNLFPNGRYWEQAAIQAAEDLQRHLGDDLYFAWVRRIWPGDTIHRISWKTICRQADAAYELVAIHQIRELERLLEVSRAVEIE